MSEAVPRPPLFGQALRLIPTEPFGPPTVYLTFDDGPLTGATEKVLALLARENASATFFLVAERAVQYPELTRAIERAGHGIGNHSLDHRYSVFFTGRKRILHWVQESERLLAAQLSQPSVGFRPPVGIRTPELAAVLRECELPLVLWNERFYDAVMPWTRRRALESAGKLRSGSIVLLHDTKAAASGAAWLVTLEVYIQSLKARGFALKALTRQACKQALTAPKVLLPLITLLLFTSCAQVPMRTSPEQSIQELKAGAPERTVVDELVKPLIDLNVNVGTVIGIVTPQGSQVFVYEDEKVAAKEGHLNGDTLFQIGSVSKMFTATLLAVLADEGRISLQDPASTLAPASFHFQSPVTERVTLAELASHSAGLSREPADLTMLWHVFRHFFTGRNPYDQLTEAVLLDYISKFEVKESERGKYYYSQIGAAFLGWLMGGLDHKGYEAWIQEKVTGPLGLQDTGFTLTQAQSKRVAVSHVGDLPYLRPRGTTFDTWMNIPAAFRPTGGYYSTVNDLMKVLRANLGLTHGKLQRAFALAHEKRYRTKKGSVGMGWFMELLPTAHEEYVFSDGISSGHTSFIGFVKKYKIGVVVLQNSINFDDKVGTTLLDRLVGAQ